MTNLEYKDIKLIPQKSILKSRADANVTATLGKHTFAVPIVAANMKSILTPEICFRFDQRNWFYVQERMSNIQFVRDFTLYAQDKFNVVSISVGITEEWLDLLKHFKQENYRLDYITIDIAYSHTDSILPFIRFVKDNFPQTYLTVGNGMTPEWVEWLESYGVDCAKIGVANGSVCSTYHTTGFKSDVSDLASCIKAAKTVDIIADGGFSMDNRTGIVCVGDFVKALVLGSQFCMSGSLFSRCVDSPAILNGYAGNASAEVKGGKKHVEGVSLQVQTNGLTIDEMMDLVEDSLKSAVSYAGGRDLTCLSNLSWET